MRLDARWRETAASTPRPKSKAAKAIAAIAKGLPKQLAFERTSAPVLGIKFGRVEPNPTYRFIRKSTEEERMLKKLALATAAVGLLMSTASADYYIVQEKATKKCKVVETRPTETTWIQVGPAAFKTQSDAEKQIKTVCVEKR